MAGILRGEAGWADAVADALRAAGRPIRSAPGFLPRADTGTSIRRYERSSLPPPRPASTLLALYPADGELTIPLTVRHGALRSHAGEVSLPGGAVDFADRTRADTALREAHEEIGLDPAMVRVLGTLDDIWIPVSNFELRPFVAAVSERPALIAHDAEVAAIVELPLRLLLGDEIVREEEIQLPELLLRAHVYRHAGVRIWGATAGTLAMLATVLVEAGLGE